MNKIIDLTKILKYCPKGTKLYSTIFGEVEFKKIDEESNYPIVCVAIAGNNCDVTADGRYYDVFGGECILFPSKEQRDWSKFTASWYKKESDTISCLEEPGKKEYGLKSFKDEDVRKFIQYIEKQAKAYEFNLPNRSYDIYAFAKDLLVWFEKQGEQEEPHGYKFVEPNFHEGDWVVNKFGDLWHIDSIDNKNYQVSNGKGNYNYFPILIQDKMHLWTIQDAKNGDVLVNGSNIFIFNFINNRRLMGYCHVNMDDGNFYNDIGRNECFCTIDAPVTPATKEQRDLLFQKIKEAGYKWNAKTKTLEELIKPKFDPKTLKPFDRVLVSYGESNWKCKLFSHIDNNESAYKYDCCDALYAYCIPYNDDTKHLVGTTDEAPEYYRYWED